MPRSIQTAGLQDRRDVPQKLYVEITTACNLTCGMCIRHVWRDPDDAYMADATFDALLQQISDLPTLATVQFGGFGEPTVHPGCYEYLARIKQTGRRITFEWALIDGENDTIEQAHLLGQLVKGLLCHVNLIPLNPTNGYSGRPSSRQRVGAFQQELARYSVSSTVRVRRGIDIQAGCGQLRDRVANREEGQPSGSDILAMPKANNQVAGRAG